MESIFDRDFFQFFLKSILVNNYLLLSVFYWILKHFLTSSRKQIVCKNRCQFIHLVKFCEFFQIFDWIIFFNFVKKILSFINIAWFVHAFVKHLTARTRLKIFSHFNIENNFLHANVSTDDREALSIICKNEFVRLHFFWHGYVRKQYSLWIYLQN